MRAGLVLGIVSFWLHTPVALGTIEDQRARLPPPEVCTDPVEGVWMAKQYIQQKADWYEFTLEIHRKEAGKPELTGEIHSHFWGGGPGNEVPPACSPGSREVIVKMPGAGTIESTPSGERVLFGSKSYALEREICGQYRGRYNPDNFSGTIDPALQEFQSVNNDGGDFVDVPQVFRRIQCFTQAPPPAPPPPPKPPPPSTKGCGCAF